MGKIWNIDGINKDYITDVNKILKEYATGLNSSQKTLNADIDVSMTYGPQVIFKLYIKNNINVDLFTVIVNFDGRVDLLINYYNEVERHDSISIDDMEKILDTTIKSEKMGYVILYLIRIVNINEKKL